MSDVVLMTELTQTMVNFLPWFILIPIVFGLIGILVQKISGVITFDSTYKDDDGNDYDDETIEEKPVKRKSILRLEEEEIVDKEIKKKKIIESQNKEIKSEELIKEASWKKEPKTEETNQLFKSELE